MIRWDVVFSSSGNLSADRGNDRESKKQPCEILPLQQIRKSSHDLFLRVVAIWRAPESSAQIPNWKGKGEIDSQK